MYIDFRSLEFYVNGTKLKGVNDLTFDINDESSQFQALGNQNHLNIRTSLPQGNITLNRSMVEKDFLFHNYSGNNGFHGFLLLNGATGQNVCFSSGYMTAYSVSFGINQQPQITTSINVFGQMGRSSVTGFYNRTSGEYALINNAPDNYNFSCWAVADIANSRVYRLDENPLNFIPTGANLYIDNNYFSPTQIFDSYGTGITGCIYKQDDYAIISSKNIRLAIDDTQNNRLVAANIIFDLPKVPVYALKNKYPSFVYSDYPANIQCELELEAEDYTMFSNLDWPLNKKIHTIKFDIFDIRNRYITSFDLGRMELLKSQVIVSKNKSLAARLTYKKSNE